MGKSNEISGDIKLLYEWAEECLFSDQVGRFLDFCKYEGYEQTEILTYSEFLILKEKFES